MKTKFWVLLLVLLFAGSLLLGLYLLKPGSSPARFAEIRSDGKTVQTVSLLQDQELTILAPGGGYNTVTVRDGKIAVTDADCPDGVCMARGFCDRGADIVCLPNRLVIHFTEAPEFDAVAE